MFWANNKGQGHKKNAAETSTSQGACALSDVCPVCQRHCASSVEAGPPLTDDQVVNHWSEQINSQHVHLLATLSGSPSVCVCSYPVWSHQRGPSAPTRWLPSASLPLNPQHGSLCGRLLHVCMRLMTLTIKCHISAVCIHRRLRLCALGVGWGGESARWEHMREDGRGAGRVLRKTER